MFFTRETRDFYFKLNERKENPKNKFIPLWGEFVAVYGINDACLSFIAVATCFDAAINHWWRGAIFIYEETNLRKVAVSL